MTIDINTATSAELRAFKLSVRGEENVTQEALDQLDGLIVDRAVEEAVAKSEVRQEAKTTMDKMDEKAIRMWPELKDKETDFYKAVQADIKRRGGKDPNAMLDAANAYGLSQGLVPDGFQPGQGTPMSSISPGNSSGPGDDSNTEGEDFLDKTSAIAEAFTKSGLLDMTDEKNREAVSKHAGEKE